MPALDEDYFLAMIYRLIILSGDRRGQQITLTQAPMIIGRDPTCEIRLNDPEIALTHAEISHTPEGLHIRDLGSMNRLLINNREVHEAYPKHGDVVEVGQTRFLIQAYVQAEVPGKSEENEEENAHHLKPWIIGGGLLLLGACMLIVIPRCERLIIAPRVSTRKPVPAQYVLPAVRPQVSRPTPPAPALQTPLLTNPVATTTPPPPKREVAIIPLAPPIESIPVKIEPVPVKTEPLPKPKDVYEPPPEPKKNPVTDLIADSQRELQEATQTFIKTQAPPTPILPTNGFIKITSTDINKFPETDQFREMRLLTIRLTATEHQQELEPGAVRIEVIFMDRDIKTGQIIPATSKGTPTALTVQGKWHASEQKTVMASYVVSAPPTPTERKVQYYGFILRVYYNELLQDELSQPKDLSRGTGSAASAETQ